MDEVGMKETISSLSSFLFLSFFRVDKYFICLGMMASKEGTFAFRWPRFDIC